MKPLTELTPKEQSNIRELDEKADNISYGRSRLARLLKDLRLRMPLNDRASSTYRWEEPADEKDAKHRATFRGQRKTIWELASLPTEEVIAMMDTTGLDKIGQLRVAADTEQALEIAKELISEGGVKGAKDAEPDATEAHDFYKARFHDLGAAAEKLDELRQAALDTQALYERVLNEAASAQRGKFDIRTHATMVQRLQNQHEELLNKVREHVVSTPETYMAAKMLDLFELKHHFDANGRIVETPFVKRMKERVRGMLRQGRAVFVHGELGAGKTEFAKDLARDLWLEKNPMPAVPKEMRSHADLMKLSSEEQVASLAGRKEARDKYNAEVDAWKARRDSKDGWEGLMVSGRKGLEMEEVVGARQIRRAETISPEEQVRRVDEGWQRQLEAMKAENPNRTDLDALRSTYEKAMMESFRSPVETQNWLGPLMQAMKEGRPLIIDEMNAIPHHVLIAMNDLLLRKPGEVIYPPIVGEPAFKVAPGFFVIATGNFKPEDGKIYVGRQQLDAAFLSRFGVISYDYLPMPTEAIPSGASVEHEREYRASAEQATMFALRLLNPDLSMDVPQEAFGSDGQIERLARVARTLQDIFSAPEKAEGFYDTVGDVRINLKETLKENVLSIRHVIPVIEAWKNEGGSHDFDDYLFLNYVVNSKARPNEMVMLYNVLQNQGQFFKTTKGWPDSKLPDSRAKILNHRIEEQMYPRDVVTGLRKLKPSVQAPKIVHFNARQVVEWLTGQLPERTTVSKEFADRGARRADEQTKRDKEVEQLRRQQASGVMNDFKQEVDMQEFMDQEPDQVKPDAAESGT